MSKISDRVIEALEEHKGLLLPVIRKLMAEAWTEGYTSGHSRAMRLMSDEPGVLPGTNPYLPVATLCKIKAGAKEQDDGSETVRPR